MCNAGIHAGTESTMSENNTSTKPDFIDRVFGSDLVKKGLAGAAASIIVAGLVDVVWGGDDA